MLKQLPSNVVIKPFGDTSHVKFRMPFMLAECSDIISSCMNEQMVMQNSSASYTQTIFQTHNMNKIGDICKWCFVTDSGTYHEYENVVSAYIEDEYQNALFDTDNIFSSTQKLVKIPLKYGYFDGKLNKYEIHYHRYVNIYTYM